MSATELFWSYRRGFVDGVATKAMRDEFVNHKTRPDLKAEYELAYKDGTRLRREALDAAAKRVGYVPNILRTCAEGEESQ